MKNLFLLFFLFLSISICKAQDGIPLITGENHVCPGQEYEYKFTLVKGATIGLTPSITVENGKLLPKSANFIAKGERLLKVYVTWDDIGYKHNKVLRIKTNEGESQFSVVTASYKGTTANDYSNYYFSSSPYSIKNGIIRIPYLKSGILGMRTGAPSIDPNNSLSGYSALNYVWEIVGTGKLESKSTYSLQYGLTDLDGTTVKVYPFHELCDGKIYGSPYTFKIERYLDAKITTTEKESCKNTNVTYKLEGAPSGSTIKWIPGNNVTLVSGQESTSAIFKTSSDGALTVNAIVTYMGKNITISNSDVWVGTPATPTKIEGISNGLYDAYTEYSIGTAPISGATSYTWEVKGDATLPYGNTGQTVRLVTKSVKKGGSFAVYLTASNKCGGSTYGSYGTIKSNSGGGDNGGIGKDDFLRSSIIESETPQSIKVYNLSGAIVHSQDNLSGDFDIKSTTLPAGIYIIEKSNGKERQSEKVILKR